MTQDTFTTQQEIEIKVRLADRSALQAMLPTLGFRVVTPETLERNTLFDTPDGRLRQTRQLLRIRQYGNRWILTHKAPSDDSDAMYKVRMESETEIADGQTLAAIFHLLGYQPVFLYEKLRTEWADGEGHLVVDITPIGDYAELEGDPNWIDATAARLGFTAQQYLAASYGQLFMEWKAAKKHPATNMTFAEINLKG